jgi:hypothetical protein
MDLLQVKETICNHCDEVFPSKGKYQYHFRRVHQNEVRIHGHDQEGITIPRSEDEKFVCICNKGYHVRQSLRRHQKKCQEWKDHEANLEAGSDSEMSIQSNFHVHLIVSNV